MKNHKIAKNSTTTKAKGKYKCRFGILRILDFFVVCLTKLKNNQNLCNKICHRFILTTKLITGWNSLIVLGVFFLGLNKATA